MLFYNTLYKIIDSQKTSTGVRNTVQLEHTHPLFKGHFPGNPVLPGVVMLQIIRECVELSFAEMTTFEYKGIAQCKFPMPIAMDEDRMIQIEMSWQPGDEGEFRLSAIVKDENAIFAQLKATLTQTKNL